MHRYFWFVIAVCFVIISYAHAEAQWSQTNGPYFGGNAFSIAVQEPTIVVGTPRGIVRSTDNGLNWDTIDATRRGTHLLFWGSKLVEADTGVRVSTDLGKSWVSIGFDTTRIQAVAASGTDLYVATNQGVFYSSNAGTTWSNNTYPYTEPFSLFIDGSRLYVATANTGIVYSDTKAATWRKTGAGSSALAIGRSGPNLILGSCRGLEYSSDGGKTWPSALPGPCAYSVAVEQGYAYAAADGIRVSGNDGVTWKSSLGASGNMQVVVTTQAVYAIGTGDQSGVYRSTDHGTSWMQIYGQNIANVLDLTAIGSNLFATTDANSSNDETYVSTDLGEHWMGTAMRHVTVLASLGDHVIATPPDGVSVMYLSIDHGIHWRNVSDTSLGTMAHGFTISGSAIYAITDRGVIQSLDSGETWKLLLPDSRIYAVAAIGPTVYVARDTGAYRWSPADPVLRFMGHKRVTIARLVASDTTLYAYSYGLLRRWADTAWVAEGYGLADKQVTALLPYRGNLIAATTNGVYYEPHGTSVWQSATAGLLAPSVNALTLAGSYLFAATGQGVWRLALLEMFGTESVERIEKLPSSAIQIYPNPLTKNETTIMVTHAVRERVDLTMMSISGVEVAHIFSGELDKGNFEFRWKRPSQLAPGIYYCIVRCGSTLQKTATVLQ